MTDWITLPGHAGATDWEFGAAKLPPNTDLGGLTRSMLLNLATGARLAIRPNSGWKAAPGLYQLWYIPPNGLPAHEIPLPRDVGAFYNNNDWADAHGRVLAAAQTMVSATSVKLVLDQCLPDLNPHD